jgi:hypothetical protein
LAGGGIEPLFALWAVTRPYWPATHTFVSAGPIFRRTWDVVVGEVVEREGFIFADILPARTPVGLGIGSLPGGILRS